MIDFTMSDTLVNIAAHLPAMARRQPDAIAVTRCFRDSGGALQSESWTYAQLDRESDAIAHGLAAVGVGKGVRTVLLVPPSLDFFALVFALFKVGAVMVCVDPGIGAKHLKRCLDEAEPTAFIGNRKAHLARRLLGWARRTNRINIVVGRRGLLLGCRYDLAAVRERGAASNQPYELTTRADDVAAILFTSGSTGPPKGVVYTHANFDAQVRALRDAFGIEPGEVDLSTFPLFALYAPAMGMTAIIPEMDFTRPGSVDPRNVIEPIERFRVTSMFGSPALLKRVGQFGVDRGVTLPTLRRVISAGAPVSTRVIRTFTRLLASGAQVHTPYGATESLPVATIGSDEILRDTGPQSDEGYGVCVGRPIDVAGAAVDLRIIRIDDGPIATWSDDLVLKQGRIGEIVVRGPVVTRCYHNRDEATRLAKIDAPQFGDGAFFHRMGDVGWIDETGRLWMCGRKSQRVDIVDRTMFTVPCEAPFNMHPAVARCALVGVKRERRVVPVLCVERAADESTAALSDSDLVAALRDIAQQREHTKPIDTFLIHPSFPVDIRHNAKIGHEKLARWAARELR